MSSTIHSDLTVLIPLHESNPENLLELLNEKWCEVTECRDVEGLIEHLVLEGELDLLKKLDLSSIEFSEPGSLCSAAAMKGHLEILKWLREQGHVWNEDTCTAAKFYGHTEVFEWARSNGCPYGEWLEPDKNGEWVNVS